MKKLSSQRNNQELLNMFTPHRRKSEVIEELPPRIAIFTEGTKTEPNYFEGFKQIINSKYRGNIRRDFVRIIPTGRNTLSLYKYAQENTTPYEYVWLVYDRDDFKSDFFDNVENAIRDKEHWSAAWSNQCIEVWFLLHFEYRDTDMDREECCRVLSALFQNRFGKSYQKNMSDLYKLLSPFTDVAMRNAKVLFSKYGSANISIPHEMVPCTKVFKLVEFLQEYM